jgi:hypothetical protein
LTTLDDPRSSGLAGCSSRSRKRILEKNGRSGNQEKTTK